MTERTKDVTETLREKVALDSQETSLESLLHKASQLSDKEFFQLLVQAAKQHKSIGESLLHDASFPEELREKLTEALSDSIGDDWKTWNIIDPAENSSIGPALSSSPMSPSAPVSKPINTPIEGFHLFEDDDATSEPVAAVVSKGGPKPFTANDGPKPFTANDDPKPFTANELEKTLLDDFFEVAGYGALLKIKSRLETIIDVDSLPAEAMSSLRSEVNHLASATAFIKAELSASMLKRIHDYLQRSVKVPQDLIPVAHSLETVHVLFNCLKNFRNENEFWVDPTRKASYLSELQVLSPK